MRRFIHPFDVAYGVVGIVVVLAFWSPTDPMLVWRVGLVMLLAYFAGGAKYSKS